VASFLNYDKAAADRAKQALERPLEDEAIHDQLHDEEVSRDFNAKFHMWNSYDEFKADNSTNQQENYLATIQQNYHPNPNHYTFQHLDRLNDYYAHKFFDWLAGIWNNEIGTLSVEGEWTIRYQLADDSWRTVRLDRANYDRISANIQHNTFMFNDVNAMSVHFHLSGDDEEHVLNTFKRFDIIRRGYRIERPDYDANEFLDDNIQAEVLENIAGERDGEYMPYYYTGDNQRIREYLKRLEIGVANPFYSCFVFALLDAGIDKNVCEKINLRCFNRHITANNVKAMVDEFLLNIRVKALTFESNGKLKYHDVVDPKSKSKDSPLITLFKHHWFNDLLDCGINASELGLPPARLTSSRLLVELFKLNLMAPLTIKMLPHSIKDRRERPIPDLKFNPKYCLDRRHTIDPHNSQITLDDVREDPNQSPKYGWKLLNRALGNCAAVGGVIKSFITRAIHGARVFAETGIHKNTTLLDINSLYPTAMSRITVPNSLPQIWTSTTNLHSDDVSYYVLEIVVEDIHSSPYYKQLPVVGSRAYYDKIDLEELQKYCGLNYSIIQGYYWLKSPHDVKLTDYVNDLYDKRLTSTTPEDSKMFKFILNHSFGRLMYHGFDTLKSKPFTDSLQLRKYVKRYGRRLVQLDLKTKTARIMRTYDKSLNFCYLGAMILSTARRIVNDYFELFTSLGIPVYLHNTDSFMIPTADVAKIAHVIGTGLGLLKLEQTSDEAVIIRASQYYMSDSHYRFTGLPKSSIQSQTCIRQFFVDRLNSIE
jgi:hypothetical protein